MGYQETGIDLWEVAKTEDGHGHVIFYGGAT